MSVLGVLSIFSAADLKFLHHLILVRFEYEISKRTRGEMIGISNSPH
jgi:hypothetical protein